MITRVMIMIVVYFKHYENIVVKQMGCLGSDCEIFLFSVKTQETWDIFDAVCIIAECPNPGVVPTLPPRILEPDQAIFRLKPGMKR